MRKKPTQLTPSEDKIYIGIDPGKNGGIYFKLGKNYTFFPIPKIGKEYDERALFKIFNSHTDSFSEMYAVIEDVHAIYGSSAGATFDFGYGCGLLTGMLVACNIPFTKVAPKKWQSQMFEGIPGQTKTSSSGKTIQKDTKKMAEMAAKRLFPFIDLRATERCKVVHDGKVDALLICEYCSRNY